MRRLRLLVGLAALSSDKSPVHLPGRGEDGGHGRCPKHTSEYLVKEPDGFFCQKYGHYVDKKDRLLP